MKLNNFHLEKMYFDCIDGDGNCFVVYWAKLRFGWLRLSIAGDQRNIGAGGLSFSFFRTTLL